MGNLTRLRDVIKTGEIAPVPTDLPIGGIAIDVVGKSIYSKSKTGDIFQVGRLNDGMILFPNVISDDLTVPTGQNGLLVQPLVFATGVTIDIATGSSLLLAN